MTTKKPRKPLDDTLAREFVYGGDKSRDKPESFELDGVDAQTMPSQKPTALEPAKKQTAKKDFDLMSKLEIPAREANIRFTLDLPESKHRQLSILAAKTGRKKADLMRLALDQLLEQMESDEE